ncbi:mRNA capping enzyme, catalytic domain-containing protein [Mortierella sp. GBAus27b]|nr:mRNA capping enzyme, catalytic domain-containing protein [Mortierella sp. GBAus27b]
MPFEFCKTIDQTTCKTFQSRIKTFLRAETDGFPGSYPVGFEASHLQLLANEEYFVTEKVAGVRYMLLSIHTPRGPACFLIDRHYEISYVPDLLLPVRDNPSKYQNETLLDGEMIVESDGNKKTFRFLVFDLMVSNGTVITQRSYSSRLGMMDQDVLAVQAAKSSEMKSKEPFTIERKTMQRSYGLNLILSSSKRHKHGGEGLIFVPVKQPYVPGPSPKLLKWKSHTTAQFQIKVTQSKERKPLYCIHVKSGSTTKFYDYVTPEHALATEWHNTTPEGKIAEFWWDAQWPTQMFERGYGLETRTGGWRFYRTREDKKDVDDEATVQALIKGLDTLVTKEQLESQIDHIRTQWKAREAGTSSNGNTTQPSSAGQQQRPVVKPISIINSQPDGQHPPSIIPSLSSPFLQSPSLATHPGSQGYFQKRDRERKSSMDDHNLSTSSSTTTSAVLSHPLPPKPSSQSRQSSVDQSLTQTAASSGSGSETSTDQEHNNNTSSANSSATTLTQVPDGKTISSPIAAPIGVSQPSTTSATSGSQPLGTAARSQHWQSVKSWMTSSAPWTPLSDKMNKMGRGERRDSKDGSTGSGSPRPVPSGLRKSSLGTDNIKEPLASSSLPGKVDDVPGASETSSISSAALDNQSQSRALGVRSILLPALPPTNSSVQDAGDSDTTDQPQRAPNNALESTLSSTTTQVMESQTDTDSSSTGTRTVNMSSPTRGRVEDHFVQRQKFSDSVSRIDSLDDTGAIDMDESHPSKESLERSTQPTKTSPLLSPLGSPGSAVIGPDDEQSSHSLRSRAAADVKPFDVSANRDVVPKSEEETTYASTRRNLTSDNKETIKPEPYDVIMKEDKDMNGRTAVVSGPLPTPSLTLVEQMAYQLPSDEEKALAMAKLNAVAMAKMEKIAEERAAKDKKMEMDLEKFKEKSRLRKEKAQKRKLQEASESPVQDRRAQPVRQINQNQGRLFNSDAPVLRSQIQSAQRQVTSPQDQQRLGYSTRKASRMEALQSAQNSPKPQLRSDQSTGNQKEQQTLSSEEQLADKSTRATVSDPNLPNPAHSDPQDSTAAGPTALHPGEANRHKRINSMEYPDSLSADATVPGEWPYEERPLDHPYRKHLDVGQHTESNHRRTHSDAGILVKSPQAAISQPQHTRNASPMRSGAQPIKPEFGQLQDPRPPDGTGAVPPIHPDLDSPEAKSSVAHSSVPSSKRGSKTRLQFILNDEDSGPESHSQDDTPQHSNTSRVERGSRSPLLHEHENPEQQGMRQVHGASVPDATIRHQPTKRQKLSQDILGMDQHQMGRTDEYEYHMLQSSMSSLPPKTSSYPPQRSAAQSDRLPQQIQAQHHPHQELGPTHLLQPQATGRRIPGEEQVVRHQPPGSLPSTRSPYSGVEQPRHGNPLSRSTPNDQYGVSGPLSASEGSLVPPERPTHSRNSSLSKPAILSDHGHHGPSYPGARVKPPPDQFNRSYPTSGPQTPGQTRIMAHTPPQQHQQPPQQQYHPHHQQQQPNPRMKANAEPHSGSYGPSRGSSPHGGYEQRPIHPQHLHGYQHHTLQQQQQMHLQHGSSNRHTEQQSSHDEPAAGYHKHASHQYRGINQDPLQAQNAHGYYDQEGHVSNIGPGRSSMYGSQSLHPSSAQERQGAPYPPHHPSNVSHDPSYRPGTRPSELSKDEYIRSSSGGRGSMNHLPQEHPSALHPSQRHHQQQPQHSPRPHEYRHASPYHHHQQPPQHPHHSPVPKVSSPRHGQPVNLHPNDHDPRAHITYGQGQGQGQGQGPSW